MYVCMCMYMCVFECVYVCKYMYIYFFLHITSSTHAIDVFLHIMSVYMFTTEPPCKLVNITNCAILYK